MDRYIHPFDGMDGHPALFIGGFHGAIQELFIDGFDFKYFLDNQPFDLKQFDILDLQVNIVDGQRTQAGIPDLADQGLAIIEEDGVFSLAEYFNAGSIQ